MNGPIPYGLSNNTIIETKPLMKVNVPEFKPKAKPEMKVNVEEFKPASSNVAPAMPTNMNLAVNSA